MTYNLLILLIHCFISINNVSCFNSTLSQDEYEVKIYKKTYTHSLRALIFRNQTDRKDIKKPAFIFFHGGGWEIGEPEWGKDICNHFSTLGFVSISFEYRLEGKHNANVLDAIADVKTAIRWTRAHSNELGINPEKLVVYGFSAGGHLAACTAMIPGFDDPTYNHGLSCVPNVLILKSAPIIIFEDNYHFDKLEDISSVKDCSPIEHIRSNLPPTLVLHGSLDPFTPSWSVREFEKQMTHYGNRCDLHIFNGINHLDWDSVNNEVLEVIDNFLESLDYAVK